MAMKRALNLAYFINSFTHTPSCSVDWPASHTNFVAMLTVLRSVPLRLLQVDPSRCSGQQVITELLHIDTAYRCNGTALTTSHKKWALAAGTRSSASKWADCASWAEHLFHLCRNLLLLNDRWELTVTEQSNCNCWCSFTRSQKWSPWNDHRVTWSVSMLNLSQH